MDVEIWFYQWQTASTFSIWQLGNIYKIYTWCIMSCILTYTYFFRIGAPFLMYNIVFEKSVTVSAKGIICSVFLIIMVLVAVTSILACFKRKLSTIVSVIYIFIYFIFVIVSLGFVYKWFECPVWNKYPRKMLINHLIIKFLFLFPKVKNSFLRLFIDISSNRIISNFWFLAMTLI